MENTFTETSRVMFNQISGHGGPSQIDIKLIITDTKTSASIRTITRFNSPFEVVSKGLIKEHGLSPHQMVSMCIFYWCDIQAYLVLLCFTILRFTDIAVVFVVVFVFHKLKAKTHHQPKDYYWLYHYTCFIVVVWNGICNTLEKSLYMQSNSQSRCQHVHEFGKVPAQATR